MPKPRPCGIDAYGFVAAPLTSPAARSPIPSFGSDLSHVRPSAEHPPRVPGRFARHRHRHRTQRHAPARRPNPAATRAPTPATSRAVAPQPGVVVGNGSDLLVIGQVDTHDRVLKWAATRAAARAARCGLDHPEQRAPSVTDVLLDAWDTKPSNRIRTTSLHPAPTRLNASLATLGKGAS